MKKHGLFLWVMCLALFVAACAGCSSVDGSSSSTSSTEGVSSTSEDDRPDSSSPEETVELQILADESLSKALAEAQDVYSEQNPNITFTETGFASSGDLNAMAKARLGSVDIEIASDPSVIDKGVALGLVDRDTRNSLFLGNLVLVTSLENDAVKRATFDDIATGRYSVCVGSNVDPVGIYANQSLSTIGCFIDRDSHADLGESDSPDEELEGYVGTPLEGKVTLGASSGEVCKLAEEGNVDIAITYASDFERFAGLKLLDQVPEETHESILYQSGICAQAPHAAEAERFIDWCLVDEEALQIWQKWGFELAA